MEAKDSSKEKTEMEYQNWEWLIEEWKYLAKLYESQQRQSTDAYYYAEEEKKIKL